MMNRDNIDFVKLHAEIRKVYFRQKELLKQGVRKRFWPENKEFNMLSHRMTVLCSILNFSKGKYHFRTLKKSFPKYYPVDYYDTVKDLDHQHKKLIGDAYKEFLKETTEATEAALAA